MRHSIEFRAKSHTDEQLRVVFIELVLIQYDCPRFLKVGSVTTEHHLHEIAFMNVNLKSLTSLLVWFTINAHAQCIN